MAKFPRKTPSELNRLSIPRMKFFGGLKGISVNNYSDLTNFSVNGIITDVSVMLSFVKAAMIPDGSVDFLCKHQEFILCCSVKDIKPVLQRSEESLSAVVAAILPVFVLWWVDCVLGAWIYFTNKQAAPGNVKLIVRFKCVN